MSAFSAFTPAVRPAPASPSLALRLGKPSGGTRVVKDTAGLELSAPDKKTVDLEGRLVKDGVKKVIRDRQLSLADLVHGAKHYRQPAEAKPLTLQGADYAEAVQDQDLDRVIRLASRTDALFITGDAFVGRRLFSAQAVK
jgi:hypothetical protein